MTKRILRKDKILGDDGKVYIIFYEVDPLLGMLPRKMIKQMEAEQQRRAEYLVNGLKRNFT